MSYNTQFIFEVLFKVSNVTFMDECTNMNVIFECQTFEYSMCLRINVKLGSLSPWSDYTFLEKWVSKVECSSILDKNISIEH